MRTRYLPGTRVEHFGREDGYYKIALRDEYAAGRRGYQAHHHGTHYAYVIPNPDYVHASLAT